MAALRISLPTAPAGPAPAAGLTLASPSESTDESDVVEDDFAIFAAVVAFVSAACEPVAKSGVRKRPPDFDGNGQIETNLIPLAAEGALLNGDRTWCCILRGL